VKSGRPGAFVNRGSKTVQEVRNDLFLFLEISKTPLPLINTSIGGVFFGAAAFPF